jgi:2-desacetyl-2-hydroxyethyl bacteriochlorophyllide A dehydrogenase
MRGIALRQGRFTLEDLEEPVPGEGQVLVATRACGICGTDLHARHHMDEFLEGLARSGNPLPVDLQAPFVLGHEFCGDILDHGPGTPPRLPAGTTVVGLPYATGPAGAEYVGYSNRFPGGFGERMVLTEKLLFAVPNGLPPEHAALVEPFAVGAHAVARAAVPAGAVIMVVGCGPIGLAVIAALKARGHGPVVGVDFSPARRGFALAMGADEVVDAAVEAQSDIWARLGADRSRQPVVFECVGRPGIVDAIIAAVPRNSLVVVVGNVLGASSIDQVVAFNKELDLRFTMNYTPREFGQTLDDVAEGRIDVAPVLTGVMRPEQVEEAFAALLDPEAHAKVVLSFAPSVGSAS